MVAALKTPAKVDQKNKYSFQAKYAPNLLIIAGIMDPLV